MSKHPVVHFEMPYDDAKRVTKFYADAFGWKMQQFGAEMGNYVLAETTETKDGRAQTPGCINGGFFPKQSDGPQSPSVVVSVESIETAMKGIVQAGGKVLGEPMEIPGIGRYVAFADTEGNQASLLQPAG